MIYPTCWYDPTKKKTKQNSFIFLWLHSENRVYVYACHSFYYYSTVQRSKLYWLNTANYHGSEDIELPIWGGGKLNLIKSWFWHNLPIIGLFISFILLQVYIDLWHSFQSWKFHVSMLINLIKRFSGFKQGWKLGTISKEIPLGTWKWCNSETSFSEP